MFCSNCGKQISDNAKFCDGCGSEVGVIQPIQQSHNTTPSASNGVKIGFSEKINDPSVKATMKKNGKGALIFAVVLVLLPIVISYFIGVSNDDFSTMSVGFAVSAVFLIFNLISFAKKKSEKQWDGVVIDKQSCEITKRDIDNNGIKTYTEYTVFIRDESGKDRKITEGNLNNSAHPYYEYLKVGDRVRYHPQFNCFYEKYDKTQDTYVYCAVCGKTNDISQEHCSYCNSLLIK